MTFEEVYYYFVLCQNRKMHSTAPADPCHLGILEFEWEQFFFPKQWIQSIEDKECCHSWRHP